MSQQSIIRVCGRACVVKNKKLLLVNNAGKLWYLPGGHMEPGETLEACAKREVYEETGYEVIIGDIIYCYEFNDHNAKSHKIECCFNATVKSEAGAVKWNDLGHDKSVTMQRFFSLEEIQALENIHPIFLKQGKWLDASKNKVYMGYEESIAAYNLTDELILKQVKDEKN
jgi:8-oxo-dGTP pyrophosphatase MutT (NUDIX family)